VPATRLAPDVLKSSRRKLGVTDGRLDRAMPEIGLQRPGIGSPISQRIAASVAQHVRMRLKRQLASTPARSTSLAKPDTVNGALRSEFGQSGMRRLDSGYRGLLPCAGSGRSLAVPLLEVPNSRPLTKRPFLSILPSLEAVAQLANLI
jgi:hypothetical protein